MCVIYHDNTLKKIFSAQLKSWFWNSDEDIQSQGQQETNLTDVMLPVPKTHLEEFNNIPFFSLTLILGKEHKVWKNKMYIDIYHRITTSKKNKKK